MRESGRNILAVVLVLAIIYSLLLSMWTYFTLPELARHAAVTAKAASGKVSLCINTEPAINTSTCPQNATQGEIYSCQIELVDPDAGQNATVIISPDYIFRPYSLLSIIPFNMTLDGNITFTPANEDVGNYSFTVTANDYMNCINSLSYATFDMSINNVNDPPYLTANISAYGFNAGQTLYAFFLDNYFDDPDMDLLNYTVSPTNTITIQILPDSQVVISGQNCNGVEYVIFTAMDPGGLTADSNLVAITCNSRNSSSPSQSNGGGGGSGGGGGINPNCKAEFECYEYHKCNITNQRLMQCVDKKGCQDSEFVTTACTYEPKKQCNETWTCSDWGPCLVNGTQYRSCRDTNACKTNITMPAESQTCEYIGTCGDGLKNCHDGSCEEGIDCGGPCGVCKQVQVPFAFQNERGIWVYIFTGVLLIILAAILVYHYFRKEINAALAKAGWYISRKKRKQYLLTKEEQKLIMAGMLEIEKRFEKAEKKEEYYELLNKYYEYLSYFLSRVLKFEGELDEEKVPMLVAANKSRIIVVLRRLLVELHHDYIVLSRDANLVTKEKIRLIIEELRAITLSLSPVEPGEYAREVQELKSDDKEGFVKKMHTHIANAYIALQFTEIEAAKKRYLEMTKDYEKMGEQDERLVYDDMRRLYDLTVYINGWAWREKKA